MQLANLLHSIFLFFRLPGVSHKYYNVSLWAAAIYASSLITSPISPLIQAYTACGFRTTFVTSLFFKAFRIKQKIIDVHGQDTIFIIMRRHDVLGNNDFLERIINLSEWSNLLRALCFIRQGVG